MDNLSWVLELIEAPNLERFRYRAGSAVEPREKPKPYRIRELQDAMKKAERHRRYAGRTRSGVLSLSSR